MSKRNFDEWIGQFLPTISSYSYYVDFDKVCRNVDEIADKLSVLNTLIGSKDIRNDFLRLIERYPDVKECISILIAIREHRFQVMDDGQLITFDLTKKDTNTPEQLADLMEETGLFTMISTRLTNITDFVYGIETGLDSNARKNRGGHQMEDLLEGYIRKTGVKYYKEMYASELERLWGIDLSAINNSGKNEKRFDFVVESHGHIYAFETNFYASSGSKLNETARSYKMIAEEAKSIPNFTFVWVTDGQGWLAAKGNLRETFDVLDTIFCIKELEGGILAELFFDRS